MFIFFFLIWIIFNGKLTLEIVAFGIVISAAMYLFVCKFFDFNFKKDLLLLRLMGLFAKYVAVLTWEILKANFIVVGMIMSSRYDIEPAVVTFKTDLKSEYARVLLANSITLTPGTITASLEEDTYIVHCLDKSLAEGMNKSVFVIMLEHMEKVAKNIREGRDKNVG